MGGFNFEDIVPIAKARAKNLDLVDPQLVYETEKHEASKQGLTSYECPCKCCHGAKQHI
jgi:cytochrome c5